MNAREATVRSRVLLLMPTESDVRRCRALLEGEGIVVHPCADLGEICAGIEQGAGAAILTEEALLRDREGRLADALNHQPPWSDFPLVVLTREGGGDGGVCGVREAANVTLVERPVRMRNLVSVVRAALRARRHQYELESQLAERERQAEALRASEESLKETDRRKDEFLAMLAHELRNPLGSILAAAELLRKGDVPSQTVADSSKVLTRQVRQMVRLVDDLLDVSRLTRGKIELRCEPVDLYDVVKGAVETCRHHLDDRGHHLRISLPSGPVRLEADPARLQQALANLLNNSAKYTEPGGRITLAAERDGDQLVVAVEDSGQGIAPEFLPQVFDLFAQEDRSLDRSCGGLGIGLTLVKGIAEMHGGSVEACSAGPGEGSTFVLRLPIPASQDPAEAPAQSHPEPAAPAAPRRVLLVDDNIDVVQMLAELLRLDGHEVHTAQDGPAGLDAAQMLRPDMVLLDVGLPGMDGFEVARRMRSTPGLTHTLLVALTGYGSEAYRKRGQEAGFHHHLVKPVNLLALQRLLADSTSPGR
jgi:signal transduction histidine kinase